MRERVAEELKQVDWSKVEARVARIREEARHTLPRSIAMGVVLVLLIGWANGGPDLAGYLWAGAQAAGACALVAGFMWWAMRRRAREAAAAQRSALELVVFYRRQVDERLRVTSFGRWFLLLMGLVWLASIAGAHTAGQITLQLFMGVITLAWAVVTSRDHRRLVAEKRELA